MRTVFNWRNMPDMISVTTTQKAVSWEQHLIYYPVAIASDEVLYYIIEPNVGFIRFDRVDEEAVVSIYISEDHRGGGVAITAINMGVREVFEKWRIIKVVAVIREENERSIGAFRKCGFYPEGKHEPEGHIRMAIF